MTDAVKAEDGYYFTPYNDNYPTCERTLAELRIYLGEMKPARATELLGISPTQSTEAGTQIRSETTGRIRTQKLNAWFLSSEGIVESRDLRRHLDWLLDQVYPLRSVLHQIKNDGAVSIRISCIWWSAYGDGGPILWPSQMSKMAELNIECGFEFAFYGDDANSFLPRCAENI